MEDTGKRFLFILYGMKLEMKYYIIQGFWKKSTTFN